VKNPVKILVASGAAGALTLALGTTAFARGGPDARSHTDQDANVTTEQTATSNTGDNTVGNVFLQANLPPFEHALEGVVSASFFFGGDQANGAQGIAMLGTGDASSSNTAGTTVSQSSTSTVSADDHHADASAHTDQNANVSTEQDAESNSGDNVVGNLFGQLNVGHGDQSNSATGAAMATTGDASSSNSSTTSVTQSSTSTVTSGG
jgi:hypothetical protein